MRKYTRAKTKDDAMGRQRLEKPLQVPLEPGEMCSHHINRVDAETLAAGHPPSIGRVERVERREAPN